MITIKPCYDCGNVEPIVEISTWLILCGNCTQGVSLPYDALTKDQMIEYWNRRMQMFEECEEMYKEIKK